MPELRLSKTLTFGGKPYCDLGSDISDQTRFQLLCSDEATERVSNAQLLVRALEFNLVAMSLKIAGGPVKARWPGSSVAVVNTMTLAPEVPKGIRKMCRALQTNGLKIHQVKLRAALTCKSLILNGAKLRSLNLLEKSVFR